MTLDEEDKMESPIRLGKQTQISAPSHPQIMDLVREMTWNVGGRRRFNGQQVSLQTFVNCVMVGLAKLGPETWNYIFDEGASVLGPALMAGEPGVPLEASRPLKKRFRWFSESTGSLRQSESPPSVNPLPSTGLPPRQDKKGRRGKRED